MSDHEVKKPVWRMNTKRHPKEKIQGNAISIDGMEFDLKTSISGLAFDRRFDSKTNIYAYQTTRTRVSKYR